MPDSVPRYGRRTRLVLVLLSLVLFLSAVHLYTPFSSNPYTAKSDAKALRSPAYPSVRQQQVLKAGADATPRRVAIIGAGASGSSAAWFLDRAAGVVAGRLGKEKRQVLSEIVILEREGHVGGREYLYMVRPTAGA
jgi:prenylcysteine oxidase/farnesylcysteine lyase